MELIVDTKRDEPVIIKLNEHKQLKTYNPDYFVIISTKEYERLTNSAGVKPEQRFAPTSVNVQRNENASVSSFEDPYSKQI